MVYKVGHSRNFKKTDVKKFPSVFCVLALLLLWCTWGCSDFFEPVESTSAVSEFEFNRWLLSETYLYPEEVANLPTEGDSVQELYGVLSDRYTRYVPPVKSEQTSISMNTSLVPGDLGMEYMLFTFEESGQANIMISRVYPNGPAGKAGVPRYGKILDINGVVLNGLNAKARYDSVLAHNENITLTISFNDTIKKYSMKKETIYAPTVFIDTIQGSIFVTITEFKPTTADQQNGTLGELRTYLDSTRNEKNLRILDLRNNPGGHVSQCIAMADLFVAEGILSTRHWYTFTGDGKRQHKTFSVNAVSGDPGESGNFAILANKYSASCSEIFISAIAENRNFPIVGNTTYGKGIGQATWHTAADGLAIITNMEFLTPKGNSYHLKGIEPNFPCEGKATRDCAIDALHLGSNVNSSKEITLQKRFVIEESGEEDYISKAEDIFGGAIVPQN